MDTHSLLLTSLEIAVPLRIAELRLMPKDEIEELRAQSAGLIAAHGDDILYKGSREGDTAKAFNALATSLAILSFAPGGVSFASSHWDASAAH